MVTGNPLHSCGSHGERIVPDRRGSFSRCPDTILTQRKRLTDMFTVSPEKLKEITEHFVSELKQGLTEEGGDIPMIPTWTMSLPDGHEQGSFLAIDLGGTNLRVCEITLPEAAGEFDIIQSKYRMPNELKTGSADELWEYVADCVKQFIEYHHEGEKLGSLPLGFTFSYPVTQHSIDHGILQRWTKGFDVAGIEGEDVVPQFKKALEKRNLPIKLAALVNDTVGTLIATAYTDTKVRIGCIFGTGQNAAYIDTCGNIPKLAHLGLPPDTPMAINCEYGAFDNQLKVLPRTPYDDTIDKESPRPGQQALEKMVAGLYLGEIFRLVLVDLHENIECAMFAGQDIKKLKEPYSLDSEFLSKIEEDPFENLDETLELFEDRLNLRAEKPELELIRLVATLIGTRAARLTATGIAAICKKQDWDSVHVGADGSLFLKYPHFKERQSQALAEILDWPADAAEKNGGEPPVLVKAAEDGSGVGAALIAALTIKRVKEGNTVGVKDPSGMA